MKVAKLSGVSGSDNASLRIEVVNGVSDTKIVYIIKYY